mgnify:CR=1 FL=1
MIKLRPYQARLINEIQTNMLKYKHIAAWAPQGSGKSIILGYIALGAMKKGNKVLILTHRQEILIQNMRKMEYLGLKVQAITSTTRSIDPDADCYCGMSQTIASRIKKSKEWQEWLLSIPITVIDECHINNHNAVLDGTDPDSYRVGLSASMLRGGNGQKQLADYYDTIVKGDSTQNLIDLGYLTPSKNFAFQAPLLDNIKVSYHTGDYMQSQLQKAFRKTERYAGIIDNYNKLTPNTKAIVFTTGSEHCVEITKQFNDAGIKAKYLLSNKMPETDADFSGEREQLLKDFANNKFKVLVNISILDTGFDEPSIETVILDFSTTSYARYSQAVGRGSRLFHGKEYFNVLDFGNNIQTHGIYEQPNPPMSLWHKVGGNGVAPTKECPIDKGGCGRLLLVSATDCKWCGYHFPTQKEIYNVELTEIIDNSETDDMNKWIAEQMLKGKNPNWILVNICIKNPLNQKGAFMEAIKVLRKADGGQFSPRYWHFFKKNILDRKKKNIEKFNK